MILVIATIALWNAPIFTDPAPLCYVPANVDCCEQVKDEYWTRCNGTLCYGGGVGHGTYIGHIAAGLNQTGYTLITWKLKSNSSSCTYRCAWCDDYGFCHICEDYTFWQCHDEDFSGSCSGS
jgi:hypothetical protein